MIRTRVFCSWNLRPRRNVNDWELEEVSMLLELLEGYHLGSCEEDERVWLLDMDTGFLVESLSGGVSLFQIIAACV